jgi:methylphosphotriester-DNA--protein-cysteine methyltransferase
MLDRRIGLSGAKAFQDLVPTGPTPDAPEASIDAVRCFLLRRLEQASLPPVVVAALDAIEQAHGALSVAGVAARCRISSRHLHRLMRLWVGYGAKRYASVIRFQATLHEMARRPALAAAALASGNGYFDQSHLTLDLTRFGGATPGRLAAAGVADFSKTRCDDLP